MECWRNGISEEWSSGIKKWNDGKMVYCKYFNSYSIVPLLHNPTAIICMIKGKKNYNFKEGSTALSAANNLVVTFSMDPEATTSITLPC